MLLSSGSASPANRNQIGKGSRQGQAAVLRDFLNRHVAEAGDVHTDFGGHIVQNLCNFVIRLAEVMGMAVGIVVNNAIMLVDCVNLKRREDGLDVVSAVIS